MPRVVLVFLVWAFTSLRLFAYETIEISTNNVSLEEASWNITEELIEPATLLHTSLKPLPKLSFAKGFDPRYFNYRFVFKSTSRQEPIYLKSISPKLEQCHVTQYDNNAKLISQKLYKDKNGFLLANITINTTVIVQCYSNDLRIVGFIVASKEKLELRKVEEDKTFFIFTGLVFGLLLYNLFLLIITRDILYAYYIMSGVLIYSLNYISLFGHIFPITTPHLVNILISLFIIVLYLFTDKYLKLKDSHKTLHKIFFILMLSSVCIHVIEMLLPVSKLSPFSALLLILYIVFISIYTYIKGHKPALFLLVALGGTLLSIGVTILIHLGLVYHYTYFAKTFMSMGLSWEMIMFSFALAYRIKTLEKEKQKAEYQALIHSKFSSMGEATGNITHQWREPLGGLGAILAKAKASLLYANPSKDELIKSIELSDHIVQHLSDTIDVFREFYVVNENEHSFEINRAIENCVSFVHDLYKTHNINLTFLPQEACFIQGSFSEFSQVILSILHNAKETLISRKIESPQITITLKKTGDKLYLSICDNGGGIDIDPIENIFKANITNKAKSSGMGLYLVKVIVQEKLKGSIRVENTQEGACFTLINSQCKL